MKQCKKCNKIHPSDAPATCSCGASLYLLDEPQGARPLSPHARIEQLQKKLRDISARRKAVKAEYDRISSKWNVLHVELHDLQLKVTEVQKLEAKKPSAPRVRKEKSMADTIKEAKLSTADKLRLCEMFNIEPKDAGINGGGEVVA